ncbi:MAG: nucleotidyltransferase domain-containing protein [bacterium]|nr:nucleotidyltransferase domain-containing protein [bacterium]
MTAFCQTLPMRPPPPNYGRFSSEHEALRAVVQRLADALHPFSIYLFGSRAEGRARPDSDFDLLVVFDDQAPNADADYDEVYAPLLEIGIGCDVIPCRQSELMDVLGDSTNPWQDSLASAKRVYEQPA